MDSFRYTSGRLVCEDASAAQLADRFGTPTYVYSKATLLDHYDKLAAAFADLRPLICFSIKCCGNIHILRILAERGAGMDVVSGGELARARAAGVAPGKIVYAGVGKTDAEIEAALGKSETAKQRDSETGAIGYFNIESEPEFENIAAIARRVRTPCRGALRVNPDVDPRTHAYTATGKAESKFGVDIARAARFFERYGRDEFLALDALHLHIGSPVYEVAPYVAAVKKVLALIDDLESRGHRITTLDLGGGFGADYETDRSPPASDYAAALVPLLRDRVSGAGVPPAGQPGLRIILEPGRAIAGNAGILLTRVLYVKEGSAGKRFVICDAGMNTLIRPALYGAFHFVWPCEPGEAFVPDRRGQEVGVPGLVTCDVVGPICESGDFLAKGRQLPPVQRGDLLAVFTAGAYGMAMASTYNSQPLPAEVLVDGAEAKLIRKRQTADDLLTPELQP
jgi:diaminopimelate decarboxylase